MAYRIKSHWRNPEDRTLEENGAALAYIIWRTALDKAINLHGKDFVYDTDSQRVAVIAELLAYQIQIADRLAYGRMTDGEREALINVLAQRVADHVQDNVADLFGPGDYRPAFIDKLNESMDEYADLSFADEKPGYGFLRYLGEKIQIIMGQSQVNRWVIDQIMDVDGPEIAKTMRKAMGDLLS